MRSIRFCSTRDVKESPSRGLKDTESFAGNLPEPARGPVFVQFGANPETPARKLGEPMKMFGSGEIRCSLLSHNELLRSSFPRHGTARQTPGVDRSTRSDHHGHRLHETQPLEHQPNFKQ